MNPPHAILDAHARLPRDERGIYWEMRVDPYIGLTNTHIDRGPRGLVDVQFGGGVEGNPLIRLYSTPAPVDPCIPVVPPNGQPVWVLGGDGPTPRIIRSGTLSIPHGFGIQLAMVFSPGGPMASRLQSGDSGSVVWTMWEGVPCIVGQVITDTRVCLPFWPGDLTKGEVILTASHPRTTLPPSPDWGPLTEPTPTPTPSPTVTTMNQNITLKNITARIEQVIITGSSGDRWEFPRNGTYWPVAIEETDPSTGTVVLRWDRSQTSGSNHIVSVSFGVTSWTRTGVASGDVFDLSSMMVPLPTPPPTTDTSAESLAKVKAALKVLIEFANTP